MDTTNKIISQSEKYTLLEILKKRFEENTHRHPNIEWIEVEKRLQNNPNTFWTLLKMEETGGEPDIVELKLNSFSFVDCAPESPSGRRSLCYDNEALESRKENKPKGSAIDMASKMGVEILNENEYRNLQKLGDFDTKTSSWIITPDSIRKLKGALFADYRYETVFIYHNGAESYYAARGFRGKIEV
jgi:hypothetical protein